MMTVGLLDYRVARITHTHVYIADHVYVTFIDIFIRPLCPMRKKFHRF